MRHVLVITLLLAACGGKQKPADPMTDEGYGNAMAAEHGNETPAPSGADGLFAGDVAFESSMVEYGTIDGVALSGYRAAPTADARGAVIVIHEWWGLNDNIKAMADKLASHGYDALAVDMYQKPAATTPDAAKALMMAAMETPAKGVDNLAQARAFLVAGGEKKVGVIGWCFGGGWALETGLTQGSDIAAVAMYYGRVKTTKSEVEALKAPLVGFFGALDKGIPVDQVQAFEAALTESKKDAQILVYDGVDHAFANPSGDRYNEDAASDAWAKTLEFFEKHL